jgi:hypothetical protein
MQESIIKLINDAVKQGWSKDDMKQLFDIYEEKEKEKKLNNINLDLLKNPFGEKEIEWRVQSAGYGSDQKIWAIVLPYVNNRAIQNRLDEVCGPENWNVDFKQGPDGGVLCGLSIKIKNQWITKWDGAENTEFEAVKGGISNSQKRSACQWGVGRYLYKIPINFAIISNDGKYKGSFKEDKRNKNSKTIYFKWDPPELPKWALPKKYYRQDDWDKNFHSWEDLIKKGEKSSSDIINFIKKKDYDLTENQIKKLQECKIESKEDFKERTDKKRRENEYNK